MSAKYTEPCQPATAHAPFRMAGCDAFSVWADAPLQARLDGLSLLLDAARGVAVVLAEIASREDVPIDPAASWAPVYLLDAAYALQSSIPPVMGAGQIHDRDAPQAAIHRGLEASRGEAK